MYTFIIQRGMEVGCRKRYRARPEASSNSTAGIMSGRWEMEIIGFSMAVSTKKRPPCLNMNDPEQAGMRYLS